jgi:HlyD family secretion protein
VISRESMESKRSVYDAARAGLEGARARLATAQAQQLRAAGEQEQAREKLVHTGDVLSKTTYRAPIAGTVTYIGVRPGEDIVPGVPETPGAYLMTIVNFASVNAEVRVDQDNIVYLHRGQPAQIRIDAFPQHPFRGSVQQVGAQAIFATSGLATTQTISNNQQAKEYKVLLGIDDPPTGLRPGMTLTAQIETIHKRGVLVVPFQSLVLRPKSEVGRTTLPAVPPATPVALTTAPGQTPAPTGVQGVFLVEKGRAVFRPIKIGILGTEGVEVLEGGEEIVTGDFTALSQLHSGAAVKIVSRQKPAR